MFTVRNVHRRAGRRLGAILAIATLAALGTPVAAAQPPPPPPPFATPNTDSCPHRTLPPAPIDASEVPAPGESSPPPLPVPTKPIGGGKLAGCGVVTPPGAPPVPADISATSWLISDLDTGRVLAAKDPHGRYRPASTIKVLLANLVLRTLDMNHVAVGTQADADVEGSRVGIGPGGHYTNHQLFQGLLLSSGNDAAHALATQMGGDKATAAKMNDLAKSLGAADTRTSTPSGLDGPGMSTSAYDLSLLFQNAMSHPLFAETLRIEHIDFPGYPANPLVPGDQDHPGFMVSNDNQLLFNYPGALGGKTGFTDDARQTFVAGAARNGHRLGVTLLKADVLPIRPWEQAARLLDYGFALPREAGIGELPGDKPNTTTNPVAVATPPSESGTGNLAQPAMADSSEQLRELLIVTGAVLVMALLLGAWRLRRKRH